MSSRIPSEEDQSKIPSTSSPESSFVPEKPTFLSPNRSGDLLSTAEQSDPVEKDDDDSHSPTKEVSVRLTRLASSKVAPQGLHCSQKGPKLGAPKYGVRLAPKVSPRFVTKPSSMTGTSYHHRSVEKRTLSQTTFKKPKIVESPIKIVKTEVSTAEGPSSNAGVINSAESDDGVFGETGCPGSASSSLEGKLFPTAEEAKDALKNDPDYTWHNKKKSQFSLRFVCGKAECKAKAYAKYDPEQKLWAIGFDGEHSDHVLRSDTRLRNCIFFITFV